MTTTFGAGSMVGVPVRRVEDPTLLRGEGTYIDNLDLPGALHLAFVRSPIAHAEISGIDLDDARAMPGVVAGTLPEAIGRGSIPTLEVCVTSATPSG